jgi:hypothetical protein
LLGSLLLQVFTMEQPSQIQIATAIAELQAEVQRQAELLQQQSNELLLLRTRPSTNAKPKSSLPHPEKFNGQVHKFDTWLPSIKAKLRVDSEAIGDATAQFYYVYLNLESHVQAMVLPQLSQAEDDQIWSYLSILNQLSRVYSNPNKVQEAEDKLYSLKQGTDSLHAFIAKFERILYEARGQDWNDVNKIAAFRQGLNTTIKNRLAQQLNLPRTYAKFIETVQQLAGRSSTYEHQSSEKKPYHSHDAMDMSTINTISAITKSPRPSSPSSPFHTNSRARSTSPAERQQLRKQGKCVRCGSSEHWVKDCDIEPYKKKVPPPGPKIVVGENGRKVRICVVDDSDSDGGYDSDASIGPYGPDSDSDSDMEELAYQELVDRMDRGRRK